MNNSEVVDDDIGDFHGPVLRHARELVSKLESGKTAEAIKVIEDINRVRDQTLFQEVGRLTRRIHNAINSFHIDMNLNGQEADDLSMMEDASGRLGYVIKLTEDAANKTMDMVEQSIPMAGNIEQTAVELHSEWGRLMRKEMKPEEFRALYKKIDAYFGQTITESNGLHKNLSDILMAQDYQDLTGQVIKRVITLVTEVESSLVDLVRMAATVEKLAGIGEDDVAVATESISSSANDEAAEGPVINPEERNDVVSGQDEVDDLLSSLGF
ncbi:MAG: protein phosphatase [Gammaproteobacteria bacterium]|nr:MAG: protein phosphatase [Gammaproteobacteria bacterium]